MIVEQRHLRITSALEQVASACDFVVAAARACSLDERAQRDCYLAVDEACTNIIQHGYPPACAACFIDLDCHITGEKLTIIIRDQGVVFDPLALPDLDPALAVHDRPPGGWGVYFIKKLMDSATYSYADGYNQLTLVKARTTDSVSAPLDMGVRSAISVTALSESVWLITVQGRLDGRSAPKLEAAFNELFERGRTALIIDGEGLDYISSAGVKVIVGAWQRARDQRGDVVLAQLSDSVRDWLHLVGLDLVLTITDTREAARLALISKKRR